MVSARPIRPRPTFLVQNNLVERLTAPVAVFARQHGIALVDRSSTPELDIDHCGIDWAQHSPVLPVGSVQFLRQLKKSPALAPFIHHDEVGFSHELWSLQHGRRMLNAAGTSIPVRHIAGYLANAGARHIRPERTDKAFVAGVYDSTSWLAVRATRDLAPELMCWVSPVRAIRQEWRCWVIGSEIVEISRYRRAGVADCRAESSPAVWNSAQDMAWQWVPARCTVMDVAETDAGLQIVEFNPLHCSGWYAGDVAHVLGAWLSWSQNRWTRPAAA